MANDNSISSDLIRGHIDTIILRSLYDGDKHGNEICLDIEDKSGGQYEIKQPTLYSALKRLETSGLVNAYWASGVGGRRRYFKLTEEGKNVCEENFNLWIHSRNIIDKLISDGTFLGYPTIEHPIEQQPQYTVPKFDASEYENYTFNPSPIIQDEDDFIEPEPTVSLTSTDDSPILKKVDDSDPDTKFMAEENENNLLKLPSVDADEVNVMQLSLIEEEVKEEPAEAVEEEIAQKIEEAPSIPEEEISDEEDDYLVIEPYSSPEKTYSDILASLFPPVEKVEIQPEVAITEELAEEEVEEEPEIEEKVEEEPDYEVKHETVTVVTERTPPVVEQPKKEEPHKTVKEEPKNPNDIDYTNILSLAQMQGFKIKTADKTNYTPKGKLYINRLISLSSTLLYLIMIIEMFAVCLPLNDVLGFNFETYLYIAIGLIIFPLFTYVALIFDPEKTVDQLPTMKYCVTASIVTVLNLILLTIAFALIMQVNLYNVVNVLLFIIFPCLVFLNIPLYFIIKYVLLSKEVFFSRE